MVKKIKVGNHGLFSLVDDEDFEMVSQVHWSERRKKYKENTRTYAIHEYTIDGDRGRIYLHRLILRAEIGEIVDHINHDTLDNRKENLRKCTHAENMRNQLKHYYSATSPYKGVTCHGRKGWWKAVISVDGKSHLIGVFERPEQAAHAYDEAARKYHGEFASLNFS